MLQLLVVVSLALSLNPGQKSGANWKCWGEALSLFGHCCRMQLLFGLCLLFEESLGKRERLDLSFGSSPGQTGRAG